MIRPGGSSTWKISLKKVGLIQMIGTCLPEVDLGKDTRNLRYPFPAKNSFIQVYKNELSYKRLRGRLVYSMQPIPYTL